MISIKQPGERVTVTFDFSALTTDIVSATVTATRQSGSADPTPQAIIDGSYTMQAGKVLQAVSGGVAGCYYRLHCSATTGSGMVYELDDTLPVIET